MKFRVLDLFSGIGGFSLGLERTGGFETVAFCEIEKYPQQILKQHWPKVPIYNDVKTLTADRLRADGITPDVICGGFPCQDISTAGRGAGLAGERSGLWFEFRRLIEEIRPSWVIAENVSALRSRGLDQVLSSLAEIGYDAEWHCIPASAVGAPHQRDRIWIVAHPNSERDAPVRGQRQDFTRQSFDGGDDGAGSERNVEREIRIRSSGQNSGDVADASSPRFPQWGQSRQPTGHSETRAGVVSEFERRGFDVADANHAGLQGRQETGEFESLWPRLQQFLERRPDSIRATWATEPDVGRVAHGVPKRVDRLKALGNAVVPQIPQLIGEAILASSHRL